VGGISDAQHFYSENTYHLEGITGEGGEQFGGEKSRKVLHRTSDRGRLLPRRLLELKREIPQHNPLSLWLEEDRKKKKGPPWGGGVLEHPSIAKGGDLQKN